MYEPIKLGIVGTNFVSDWMCENTSISTGIANYAVFSRSYEHGEEFAAKHEIKKVYTDYSEFLSDIDAVYIASPNALHFPQAKAAIERGRHVLIEKPATLNELEFRHLEALAKDKGVIIMEAMRPAHDPAFGIIKDAIAELGPIRRAILDFSQYSSRYDRFKAGSNVNTFDPKLGNAALMDLGVYGMSCAVMLFGAPGKLTASSVKLHNGMEGMGSVQMDYATHQVTVIYSKINDSYNPSVIIGEDGCVTIGKLSTLDSIGLHVRGGKYEPIIEHRSENNMIYEIADFVRGIKGEIDVTPFNRITKITLGLMDEVRRQTGISFPTEMK